MLPERRHVSLRALFGRVLSAAWDTSSTPRRALVRARLEPADAAAFDRALDGAVTPSASTVAAAWQSLDARIAQEAGVLTRTPRPGLHGAGWQERFGSDSLRRGAASALLLVLAVLGLGKWMSRSRGVPNSEPAQIYQTAAGQRSTVHLRDGSTMMLAPATSVSITAQEIAVAGEAYFSVIPQSNRLFVVRTRNAVVQVLGTRFAVRQYPNEVQSRVVVEDGRVALFALRSPRARDARRTVVTSKMVALVADSGVTVSSGVATQEYTGWTQGTLVFDRVPLGYVVDELVRAYGVDIKITDSVLAKQTMRLEVSVAEDPLSRVLDVIGTVTGAQYEQKGRIYVLSPGRAQLKNRRDAPKHHSFPQPEQFYGR